MMLPFGRVVVVTQAHGYIGVTGLIITTAFYVIVPYYLLSFATPKTKPQLMTTQPVAGRRDAQI